MRDTANIVIKIGTYKAIQLHRTTDSAVQDITGWTYRAMVRDNTDSTAALATFTCTVTSGGGGVVVCALTSGQTAALSVMDAVWDVEETSTSGQPTILFGGRARIRQPVTR